MKLGPDLGIATNSIVNQPRAADNLLVAVNQDRRSASSFLRASLSLQLRSTSPKYRFRVMCRDDKVL